MVARHWNDRRVRCLMAMIVLVAAGWLTAPLATAGDLDKLDTSLKLVPADAAFYSSMLRNREQFEAIRNSKAWAKVEAMPVVQMGLSLYKMQLATPGSKVATFDAALKNPEVRKIADLAADMVSDEVFVYGDDNFVEFLDLMQNVVSALRYEPAILQATGEANGRNPKQIQTAVLLSVLAEHVDQIEVPNLVVGFKLKNADLAKEQLIKLEAIGNIVLEANEHTQGRFKKTKVGDHEYLVLELDGEMIPWDELPMDRLEEAEAEEGDAQKVIDQLKESKLVIALGIRDNYLLASIGSSLDGLEKLGEGERLIDREEFKPLEKFVDKPLTSISYASEEMNQQANNQEQNIDALQQFAERVLPLAKLTDEQNAQINKDAAEFAGDIKGLIPEVGAQMSLSFLADRGIEGYCYSWGDHGRLDGSKPLGLLQHVGGNPLLGIVGRAKANVADYDLMVKWAKTAYGYFETLGLPNIPEEEREKAKEFLAAALPLVARMDKVNRDMLIPALADGQSAFVLDQKLTSKQFIETMPETEAPMPMIEPAIVIGVTDAKLLKQAIIEYRSIINGLIDAVRQIEGSEVPEFVEVPELQMTKSSSGAIYSYTLPKEWGVDAKIVPNFGLSSDTAVISLSHDHTERLLKATPLAVGGLLDKADRPMALAVWLDWAAIVETASPWIDFAVVQAAAEKGVGDDQQKMVTDQVHTGIDVAKSLRGVTAESYLEDDVLVTHTLTEIHDVAK